MRLILACWLLGLSIGVIAEPRFALVIGNKDYPKGGLFLPLTNPLHDAQDMAELLRTYQFKVLPPVLDGDQQTMEEAIQNFVDQLPQEATALLYYSGHGVQVQGVNYLIPVKYVFRDAADVQYKAVNVHQTLEKLKNSDPKDRRSKRVNILILDACLENLEQRKGFERKGLADMSVTGVIVGYATSPGDFSYGNRMGRNSVYTSKLLEVLRTGGHLPIERVFKQARIKVAEITDQIQIPATQDALMGDFCFDGCVEIPQPPLTPQAPVVPREKVFQDPLKDGGLGPKMVWIPKGSFNMGSDKGDDDEKPVHKVTINYDYAIGQYEVTRGQFRQFVNATQYQTEAERGDGCWGWIGTDWKQRPDFNWRNAGFVQTDQHPVLCVSWNDAKAYAQWLAEQTGKPYRLPSEAEWEYACRAGTTTAYSFGDDANQLGNYAWYGENSGSQTHPVGEKKSNAFGLYDMHGNVWEWLEDVWHENYQGAPVDGSAWMSGRTSDAHPLRGGSWGGDDAWLRCAFRSWGNATNWINDGGLRLSRM